MKAKAEGARVMLRLPHELREWVEQRAAAEWIPMNAVVIKCIRLQKEAEQQNAVG
jgi:predicted HicB family RNase H-like nuclease